MPPEPRRKSRLGRSPAEPRPTDEEQPPHDEQDDDTESKQESKVGRKQERKQESKKAADDDEEDDTPPPHDPRDADSSETAATPQWGASAILGGGIDPEDEWVPTGWRGLGYVKDAVRLQAATSRNRDERKAQVIVTNALKAYLDPDVLDQAYYNRHGRPRPHL